MTKYTVTFSSRGKFVQQTKVIVDYDNFGPTEVNHSKVQRTVSRRVAEIERQKSVRYWGACNCGSKTCIGNCADAETWRKGYMRFGRVASPKEIAETVSVYGG